MQLRKEAHREIDLTILSPEQVLGEVAWANRITAACCYDKPILLLGSRLRGSYWIVGQLWAMAIYVHIRFFNLCCLVDPVGWVEKTYQEWPKMVDGWTQTIEATVVGIPPDSVLYIMNIINPKLWSPSYLCW